MRQKFTSKERDNETSLDYFLARYYSSTQGRFTSPDIPFADQNEEDPQSWNLYAYVGNNALKYTDPFGMWKKVSCGDGDCWEAEEGDTLKTLAKQSGVSFVALNWAFGSFEIKQGETVISTTGVKENYRAWVDEAIKQLPTFEFAGVGGIVKLGGQTAANAAGSLLSRVWAGIRFPPKLGPGEWVPLPDAARRIANEILKKWKHAGVGAGARSGQHDKPYLAAAKELREMLKKHGEGWSKEFKEVIEKKIKDFESKGNINEKIDGRGGKR